MKAEIIQILQDIEIKHDVRILYACESGSRAWGFASPDSDFDVRFIYVHNVDHYLQIDDHKDVIELPVNEVLDVNGWDIRKALRLFRKSNAPLYEWLQSPIVYQKEDEFYKTIFPLMESHFSLKAGVHHYLSMARNCFHEELQKERVKIKKYFYALRPILACKWIVEKQQVPPMEFKILRTLISDAVLSAEIDALMDLKAASDEKTMMDANPVLNDFIKMEIDRFLNSLPVFEEPKVDSYVLNQLFKSTLI